MAKNETGRVVAVDFLDDAVLIAEGSLLSDSSIQETTVQGFEEQIARIIGKESDAVVATTLEGRPRIEACVGRAVFAEPLPRLCAIYWSFHDEIGDDPCLVLSVGRQTANAGLIQDGRLNSRKESQELSLEEIWARFVRARFALKQQLEKHQDQERAFFEIFCNILRTGVPTKSGALGKVVELNSSAKVGNAFMASIDPSNAARWLILADWAGSFCNLPELLATGRAVRGSDAKTAFQLAARGLIAYGLHWVKQTGHLPSVSIPAETPQSQRQLLQIVQTAAAERQASGMVARADLVDARPSDVADVHIVGRAPWDTPPDPQAANAAQEEQLIALKPRVPAPTRRVQTWIAASIAAVAVASLGGWLLVRTRPSRQPDKIAELADKLPNEQQPELKPPPQVPPESAAPRVPVPPPVTAAGTDETVARRPAGTTVPSKTPNSAEQSGKAGNVNSPDGTPKQPRENPPVTPEPPTRGTQPNPPPPPVNPLPVNAPPVEPTTGSIHVRAPVGARVFLDNSQRGVIGTGGDLVIPDVSAGSHNVRITQGTQEFALVMRVLAGSETPIEATLKGEPLPPPPPPVQPAPDWIERFQFPKWPGTQFVEVSLNQVRYRYERRNKNGSVDTEGFVASCSEIAAWRPGSFGGSFHIVLKDGKKADFDTKGRENTQIQGALSRACPQR